MSYEWDNKKPTAQMLGRWQPFHDGHYALFEKIILNFFYNLIKLYSMYRDKLIINFKL